MLAIVVIFAMLKRRIDPSCVDFGVLDAGEVQKFCKMRAVVSNIRLGKI